MHPSDHTRGSESVTSGAAPQGAGIIFIRFARVFAFLARVSFSLEACRKISFVAAFLFATSQSSWAIELGQIDDFEDGTEQNWIWGRDGFGGPTAIPPFDDVTSYVLTESFGGGDAPGSRMALLNREQWTGDYLAAGVSLIRLDAINDGPNFAFEDMTIRIAFSSQTATIGSGRIVTTQGYPLARGEGWKQFEFDLTDMTAMAGSNVPEVLSSVTEMRIISAADPVFIGDQILARVGVDNIVAESVPEPTIGIAWLVWVMLALRGRRSLTDCAEGIRHA